MMKIKEKVRLIKNKISALYIAFYSKDLPIYVKIIIGVTVFYALSPIDLIPDFISILGYLDDIIILPALIIVSIKLIPKDIMEECEKEAEGIWSNGKPKKWRYAIPIIIIWVIIVMLIIKAIFV